MVKDLNMTCDELIDDDVETLVYQPRSYIEDNPDFIFDPSASTKLERKNKSHEKIPSLQQHGGEVKTQHTTTKRGSFSDLKNNILTRVGTPRGNRRSKTIVQRCESAGERLKSALGRTSSLDVLGSRLQKPPEKHHKSMEEELMKGFSSLTEKTVVTRTKVESARKHNHNHSHSFTDQTDNSLMLNVRGKDRSHSCPTYPTIYEEDVRTVVKSSSYDDATYKSNLIQSSQCNTTCEVVGTHKGEFPTIKIEEYASENCSLIGAKSAPLQRKHSQLSVKSTSNTSLCSLKTNSSSEYLSSSDNSSVFNSEHSIISSPGHTSADDLSLPKFKESETTAFYKNAGRRPKSFVDKFKRANEEEFVSSFTLPRNTKVSSYRDCNSNTLEPKSFNEKEEENNKIRSQTLNFKSKEPKPSFEVARGRASSMIELSDKNTSYEAEGGKQQQRRHEQLRKTTSNIYALASPSTIKKLFKKTKDKKDKRRSMPVGVNKSTPDIVAAHASELTKNSLTGSRKCIHIESLL